MVEEEVLESASLLPTRPVLEQNIPNPFNATTVIRFWIPDGMAGNPGELAIYNLAGQRVRSWSIDWLDTGVNRLDWDGRDEGGIELASGVYVYRLRVGEISSSRKMVLVR